MTALQISRLDKSYGAGPVLRDVSFAVTAGELVAILGASGSGKTTLLRLIAGFEPVERGEIRIDGELVAAANVQVPPQRRRLGYMAQEGALFPHLSVAGNITFGLSRAQRRAGDRVAELLALVGLPGDYAGRAPQSLSGGEQQRVALARALAPRPKLILLDEPFSALDAGLRGDTRQAVAAGLRAAGATAILVTHDQAEALSLGDRVGVLRGGRLAQMAPPAELYRHPADADLAGFIGDAVITPGLAANGRVACALGDFKLPAGAPAGAVTVMVRPEQIKLHTSAAQGGVPARIGGVEFYGHDAMVRLLVADAPDITARLFSQMVPDASQDVWINVEGDVSAFPI